MGITENIILIDGNQKVEIHIPTITRLGMSKPSLIIPKINDQIIHYDINSQPLTITQGLLRLLSDKKLWKSSEDLLEIYNTVNLCRMLNQTYDQKSYIKLIDSIYKYVTTSIMLEKPSYYRHQWFFDRKMVINLFFILDECEDHLSEELNLKYNNIPYIDSFLFNNARDSIILRQKNKREGRKPNEERITLWYAYMVAFACATGYNITKIQKLIIGNNNRNIKNPSIRPAHLSNHTNPSQAYKMYLERIFMDLLHGRKVL